MLTELYSITLQLSPLQIHKARFSLMFAFQYVTQTQECELLNHTRTDHISLRPSTGDTYLVHGTLFSVYSRNTWLSVC